MLPIKQCWVEMALNFAFRSQFALYGTGSRAHSPFLDGLMGSKDPPLGGPSNAARRHRLLLTMSKIAAIVLHAYKRFRIVFINFSKGI